MLTTTSRVPSNGPHSATRLLLLPLKLSSDISNSVFQRRRTDILCLGASDCHLALQIFQFPSSSFCATYVDASNSWTCVYHFTS
jgi:hypothetical protein